MIMMLRNHDDNDDNNDNNDNNKAVQLMMS